MFVCGGGQGFGSEEEKGPATDSSRRLTSNNLSYYDIYTTITTTNTRAKKTNILTIEETKRRDMDVHPVVQITGIETSL